jgi:hypothetical protein
MTSPIKAEMPERIAVTIYQDDTMDILMNDMYPPIGCKAYQEFIPASSLTALQAELEKARDERDALQVEVKEMRELLKRTLGVLKKYDVFELGNEITGLLEKEDSPNA